MIQSLSDYSATHKLLVKVINVSNLGSETRLEAEFYNKNISKYKLSGLDVISETQYGTSKELNEEMIGFPILRLNEFETWFIGKPAKYCNLISDTTFEDLKLRKNDVLVCRTNGNPKYVGKSAIVMEDTKYAYASYLFKIKTNELISPSSLVAFLNCTYGREEIEKYSIVSNQANFSPAKFRLISIPSIPTTIQIVLDKLFQKSYELKKISEKHLSNVSSSLSQELCFEKLNLTKTSFSSRTLLDYSNTSRLDGEYWLPKYDQIETQIKKYKNGHDSLDNLVEISSETIKIDKEKNYQYAELANVNSGVGLLEEPSTLTGAELPSRAKMRLRKNDVVVSSVEGSADKVALIKEDVDNLVGSTGFFVLRSGYLSPEVTLALLRVPEINALYKRQAQGTILTAVPRSSLNRVILPKIPKEYQEILAKQISDAHTLHETSKKLLEIAKRAVEIFIEEDEESALAYIKANYEQV